MQTRSQVKARITRFAVHSGEKIFFVYREGSEDARRFAEAQGISVDRIEYAGVVHHGGKLFGVPIEYDGTLLVDQATPGTAPKGRT